MRAESVDQAREQREQRADDGNHRCDGNCDKEMVVAPVGVEDGREQRRCAQALKRRMRWNEEECLHRGNCSDQKKSLSFNIYRCHHDSKDAKFLIDRRSRFQNIEMRTSWCYEAKFALRKLYFYTVIFLTFLGLNKT